MWLDVIAAVALATWIYLLFGRGGFWLCRERDDDVPAAPQRWPRVTAVVPARNEAECIAQSVGSLARQDYPGEFSIVLVDDDSDDGTANAAERAVAGVGADRFNLIASHGVAPGWTGKLWALQQGIAAANDAPQPPDYLLLTDADIVHTPDSVRALVARAEAGGHVLTSLMAKLRCESLPERSHVPAFVFFFQMLFPFRGVNDPHNAMAGAAGGCMLVKADALKQAGGRKVGLAAELHDAFSDPVAVRRFLERVDHELLGDLRRGQALGGVVVALVAHHADQLGGQCAVEQRHDVVAPRAIARRHCALVERTLGRVQAALVQHQALLLGQRQRRDLAGFFFGTHGVTPAMNGGPR